MSSSKSSKIFLANVSSKVRRRDLEDAFDKFGKIVDITLKEGRDRFAFIEFDDVRDAEDALDKMNNYELFGRKIRIEFAHGGKRNRGESQSKSASKKNTPCFICNKKGHWANECPKGDGTNIRQGKCFLCGSTSHKMKDCSKKRSISRSRSPSSRSRSRSRSKDRKRSRSRGYSNSRSISRDRRKKSRDRSRDRNRSRERSRDRNNRNGFVDRRRRPRKSRSKSRSSRDKSLSKSKSMDKKIGNTINEKNY